MSHFYLIAIVPGGTDPEATIAEMMAHYHEGRTVPRYERRCWCVGRAARDAARKTADEMAGTIDSLGKSFHEAHPLPPGLTGFDLGPEEEEERRLAWEKHIAPHQEAEKLAFERHPNRESPEPGCEECGGSGKEWTTYNPDSQWDWYVIGGRWDGTIQHKEDERRDKRDGGFNFGDEHHNLKHNSLPVRAVLANWVPADAPFAILTPGGTWHQRGKMGWFGVAHDEQPIAQWRTQAKAILADYAAGNFIAVGLDCHI